MVPSAGGRAAADPDGCLEYGPGEFSVTARAQTELVGATQRIVRGAWLFSAVIVIGGSARLRAVLEDVDGALGLEWDATTTGRRRLGLGAEGQCPAQSRRYGS